MPWIDAGSITKAARQLHLSQPPWTASVKKLGGGAGGHAVERFARGVTPTDAGRRLLLHARRIDAQLWTSWWPT
ncbi:MAG: LysR family transcriptional regulator [Sandaracinaceae bacterium]|nr:LysR family transcriptional regulator [Sandaracinaceae bacterium]